MKGFHVKKISIDDWVTLKEAAELVGKSRNTIYNWLEWEEVKIEIITIGDKTFYSKDGILAAENYYSTRREGRYKQNES